MLRGLAFVALLAAVGCTRSRGTAQMGDECHSDFDCTRGYCVQASDGSGPICTVTCANNEGCPDGWSCSGVTEGGVVVCIEGAATPFGY